MTGDWIIQRKMHDGCFSTYAEGYATAERAKTAAARAGKSPRHFSTWRVVFEGAGEPVMYETTFRPGGRAKWVEVELTMTP